MNKSKILRWAALAALLAPPAALAQTTVIDLLVLYTPAVAERYAGDAQTRVNHLVGVSNQVLRDSGLDVELRVVHAQQVPYAARADGVTALKALTFKTDPAFAQVDALREQYGADLVLFYRPYQNDGGCGVAWVGGYRTNGDFSAPAWKEYGYSHVASDTCADYVTAHELGHNLGLTHSRAQDGVGGTLPYALGHGEHGSFTTIMAYQSAFGVSYWNGKVYKFSSPALKCGERPCGVDRNDPVRGADAVHALRISAPQVAAYFETKVDPATGTPEGGGDSEGGGEVTDLAALKQAFEAAREAFRGAVQEQKAARKALADARRALRTAQRGYNRQVRQVNALAARVSREYAALQQVVDQYNGLPAATSQKRRQRVFDRYLRLRDRLARTVQSYQESLAGLGPLQAGLNEAEAAVAQRTASDAAAVERVAATRAAFETARQAYREARAKS